MLFAVRHGERCDLVINPEEKARVTVDCDSPLTQNGLIMADRTGVKIKELLQGDETNVRNHQFSVCKVPGDLSKDRCLFPLCRPDLRGLPSLRIPQLPMVPSRPI